MPSTYTDNLGVEKPATGEQEGTWGTTDNTNYDIIDQAISGYVSITLGSAGSSGSPNDIDITDGALSNGRNPYIQITDGGDLGADVYVRITPNEHKKIGWIENALSGSRDLYVFQGTYSASNDVVIPPGQKALLRFDGGGTGAVVTSISGDSSSSSWVLQNSSATLVLGNRYEANAHSGITYTLPSTYSASTSGRKEIWIANFDNDAAITVTPASGDAIYFFGNTLGTNQSLTLNYSTTVLLVPRTANTNWDAFVFQSLDSNGNLPVRGGDLAVTVTSGKGLTFAGQTTTAATGASTTNSRMIHYEEGTWTPNLWDDSLSSSEGQTYTARSGTFTRIGNRVWIEGYFELSSRGTLSVGQFARVGPLPFVASSSAPYGVLSCVMEGVSGTGIESWPNGIVEANTSYFQLWTLVNPSSTKSEIYINHFSSVGGTKLWFSGSYTV